MIDPHLLLHELHEATEEMRAQQRRYYGARRNSNASRDALVSAMAAERKVDALLTQLRTPTGPKEAELP